jgi:hypothetical protein
MQIAARHSALVVVAAGLALGVTACGGKTPAIPSSLSAADPLLKSIGSAVPGLSQSQSILGAGSLLGLAKGKMPSDQFSKITDAIPGSNALLDEAKKMGLPKEMTGLASVNDFLGKSGISSAQVNQMVPVLTNSVSGKVSPDVASAFSSALR